LPVEHCLASPGIEESQISMVTATRATRPLRRPAGAVTLLKPTSIAGDVLAAVIGVASSFSVRLVGALPISEIVLLPLLPILLFLHGRRVLRPGLKMVFILMGLWLFGEMLTDLYRGTAAVDWLRGDAAIVFFAIDLIGLAVLLAHNERRKTVFIAALAAGSLLAARFQPSDYMSIAPWKFGYSFGANLGVALISCYFYARRHYLIVGLLMAGMVGVNLILNFRSPVLTFLITIALVLPVIPERLGRLTLLPRAGTIQRVVVLAVIALSAGLAARSLVRFATFSGVINSEEQARNEAELKSGGGMLLGGRPEILVSSRAVMDSPILGHGSAPKDYKYIEMLNDLEAENGTPLDLQDIETERRGLIPTHSHLMGSWVTAGILGALFWAYIFWLVLKGVVRAAMVRPPLAPLLTFLLVSSLWNVLFSPFGSTERINEALSILITLDLLEPAAAIARTARANLSGRFSGRRWVRHPNPQVAFPPR
jgi:hypothetical protein